MIVELIGYLGSLLVVISMLMTSVVQLRIINTMGSFIFAGYALVIHSYPTAAMNACIILINLYGLFRLYKNIRHYSIVRLSPSDGFVKFFLDKYELDMKQFFPHVNKNLFYDFTCLICHDSNPVGILLAKTGEDDCLNIYIDYTVPAYRDCSVGKYLYRWLEKEPFKKLVAVNVGKVHKSYLMKMGFLERGGHFEKEVEFQNFSTEEKTVRQAITED